MKWWNERIAKVNVLRNIILASLVATLAVMFTHNLLAFPVTLLSAYVGAAMADTT